MALKKLLVYFETSPAIRLLNAKVNAPFIIDFLQSQFKREQHLSIEHSDLLISLGSYIEDIREEFPDALKGDSDRYLSCWLQTCPYRQRACFGMNNKPKGV